ncbi:Glycoside hydrolase, catalytic domain-containing protein [Cynara cardunculus var. scolymus]|uniref:beta-galactosidase n=1 Tax=Cynara cardunculus var. scolymus TaxID=59895 RepID=A0A103YD69_CYNCS|nr:Glycoside hydrolase, catalytic domain-containing protein [Cynara cardunculus var. scolymus]
MEERRLQMYKEVVGKDVASEMDSYKEYRSHGMQMARRIKTITGTKESVSSRICYYQYTDFELRLSPLESLFSWQGGPIIMLQIENEYRNIEDSYGQKRKDYMKWAANMAVGLGPGVPWIDACNGYYCDGYTPNSKKKPVIWTENWDGWIKKGR